MKKFKHDFEISPGIIDLSGINGYLKALREVYKYLLETTGFKPENRYVDACEILDRITNTTKELQPFLDQEYNKIKDELQSLTKSVKQ